MRRRDFIKATGATLPLAVAGCAAAGAGPGRKEPDSGGQPHYPGPLSPGDRVALVCPGGPITPERLEKATSNVTTLGYDPVPGEHVLAQNGYNAGTVQQRLRDLHAAYVDPGIKAIWAIRGGYGCTQLLPGLNFRLIRSNPKWLIGYSDLTALLNPIYQRTCVSALHGPVASSSFTELAERTLGATLSDPGTTPYLIPSLPGGQSLHPGLATGRLVGGNLSLLAALCGTPWQIDVAGKIVLIEDVGESPYRIDRMLVQLNQASDLSSAAGIALGDFVDCEKQAGSASLTLEQTLRSRLAGLGIPVYRNFAFGHGEENAAIPIGANATLDAAAGELRIDLK